MKEDKKWEELRGIVLICAARHFQKNSELKMLHIQQTDSQKMLNLDMSPLMISL